MTSIDEIEQSIKPFMLTKASFTIDNKTIKQGKVLLFTVKDFFCVFTLVGNDKNDKKVIYELPYPFSLTSTVSSLEFNYTMDNFCLGNNRIKEQVNKVKLQKTSKFFNKKVVAIFEK